MSAPDAFKPRERQRATNGDSQNWPRSVVCCVGELSSIIRDAAYSMTSLPKYANLIAEVYDLLAHLSGSIVTLPFFDWIVGG